MLAKKQNALLAVAGESAEAGASTTATDANAAAQALSIDVGPADPVADAVVEELGLPDGGIGSGQTSTLSSPRAGNSRVTSRRSSLQMQRRSSLLLSQSSSRRPSAMLSSPLHSPRSGASGVGSGGLSPLRRSSILSPHYGLSLVSFDPLHVGSHIFLGADGMPLPRSPRNLSPGVRSPLRDRLRMERNEEQQEEEGAEVTSSSSQDEQAAHDGATQFGVTSANKRGGSKRRQKKQQRAKPKLTEAARTVMDRLVPVSPFTLSPSARVRSDAARMQAELDARRDELLREALALQLARSERLVVKLGADQAALPRRGANAKEEQSQRAQQQRMNAEQLENLALMQRQINKRQREQYRYQQQQQQQPPRGKSKINYRVPVASFLRGVSSALESSSISPSRVGSAAPVFPVPPHKMDPDSAPLLLDGVPSLAFSSSHSAGNALLRRKAEQRQALEMRRQAEFASTAKSSEEPQEQAEGGRSEGSSAVFRNCMHIPVRRTVPSRPNSGPSGFTPARHHRPHTAVVANATSSDTEEKESDGATPSLLSGPPNLASQLREHSAPNGSGIIRMLLDTDRATQARSARFPLYRAVPPPARPSTSGGTAAPMNNLDLSNLMRRNIAQEAIRQASATTRAASASASSWKEQITRSDYLGASFSRANSRMSYDETTHASGSYTARPHSSTSMTSSSSFAFSWDASDDSIAPHPPLPRPPPSPSKSSWRPRPSSSLAAPARLVQLEHVLGRQSALRGSSGEVLRAQLQPESFHRAPFDPQASPIHLQAHATPLREKPRGSPQKSAAVLRRPHTASASVSVLDGPWLRPSQQR